MFTNAAAKIQAQLRILAGQIEGRVDQLNLPPIWTIQPDLRGGGLLHNATFQSRRPASLFAELVMPQGKLQICQRIQ